MDTVGRVIRIEGDFVTVSLEDSKNTSISGETLDFLKPGLNLQEDDLVRVHKEHGLSQIEEVYLK